MKDGSRALPITCAVCLGLALVLLWASMLTAAATLSGGATNSPASELHVCPSGCAFASIQSAVDAADPGAVIKVATGTYTDIHIRDGITQVVYVNKSVTLQGGYMAADWTTPDPAANPTTLDAQRKGRGLVISGTISSTIAGFDITGGDAAGLGPFEWGDVGGGIFVHDATTIIGANRIFSNTAPTGGGGVFVNDSEATLSNNLIISNTGTEGGGAGVFLFHSLAILNGNTIRGNRNLRGGWGGGIYVGGSDATLTNNLVTHNSAYLYGGGVSISSSTASVSGNVLQGNNANRGGGVHLYFSDVTLRNNLITGNTTNWRSGGVDIEGCVATLENNVVADNYALMYGSGILITHSTARFLHTTIARNTGGDGSGVHVLWDTPSTAVFTNTIVVNHAVGITVSNESTVTLNATLWHANDGGNTGGAGSISTLNDYSGDPAFGIDGYHLTDASAAIDRGVVTTAGVTDDIDGDKRPQGLGYDLGADEFQQGRVFLPLVIHGGH
jgi:hypothetical protein